MSTSVLLLAYKLETEGMYKSFFNDLAKFEPPEWHLSILIFNYEYSYSNRGITIQKIYDKPTQITYMDYTEITKGQLDHFVNIVLPASGWTKDNYDLSVRNCQHFVHILLEFLEIDEPIPNYYIKSRDSYKNIPEIPLSLDGEITLKELSKKNAAIKLSIQGFIPVAHGLTHSPVEPQTSISSQEDQVGSPSLSYNQVLPLSQHSSIWQFDQQDCTTIQNSSSSYQERCQPLIDPKLSECPCSIPLHESSWSMTGFGSMVNIISDSAPSSWPLLNHARRPRAWLTTRRAGRRVRGYGFGNYIHNNTWGG